MVHEVWKNAVGNAAGCIGTGQQQLGHEVGIFFMLAEDPVAMERAKVQRLLQSLPWL